jgi:nucleoside 2-deoxyribosyltransferase
LLASQGPERNDVPGKVRYLLAYIAHKSRFPGDATSLEAKNDYPICFAANLNEFEFYVQYAKDAGFLDRKPVGMRSLPEYWLTAKGWEETRRIRTLESPYAFVAMSFSKEGERGKLLTRAFEQAIKPAIEDEACYQKAIRVDKEEFLGDIVFEIIARIKECRFVVADVTNHRNGVYFEAGYAMGMNLPVIWMCHQDDIKNAHFDTSHLNHIVWDDDTAKLRRDLANRILATIGRGPKRITDT